MSASKRYYESNGYSANSDREEVNYEVGQRFIINYGLPKINHGTWEIVSLKHSPLYGCSRVLKNGGLTKSDSANSYRRFFGTAIKQAIERNE